MQNNRKEALVVLIPCDFCPLTGQKESVFRLGKDWLCAEHATKGFAEVVRARSEALEGPVPPAAA